MSKVVKHEKYEPVLSLRRDINDLFDHFWNGDLLGSRHNMHLDIIEEDDSYRVMADMPGINEKDIEITCGHNYLTVSAKREHTHKDKKHHAQERYYGAMQRTISLPDDVNTDNIQAKYQNGVLALHIPKSEAHKPKKITIQS